MTSYPKATAKISGANGGTATLPSLDVLVWVAARNEAQNLPALLQSLAAQQTGNLSWAVVIANDDSTDQTWQVLEQARHTYPWLNTLDVLPGFKNQLIAKARVLSALDHWTQQYYPSVTHVLVTDADVLLPPSWIASMVAELQQAHLTSGITTMRPDSAFACLQGLDWLLALHVVHLLDYVNVGITALGNNYGFRYANYSILGGYSVLHPSIVEDFQLYHQFRAAGFQTTNQFSSRVLAQSYAPETTQAFFKQRVRWLQGGLQTDSAVQVVFFGQFLWYPLLLTIGLTCPTVLPWITGLIGLRLGFIYLFGYLTLARSGWPNIGRMWWTPLAYDVYFHWAYLGTVWHFLKLKKQGAGINWKDRELSAGQ